MHRFFDIAISSGFDIPLGETVLSKSWKNAVFFHLLHKNIL